MKSFAMKMKNLFLTCVLALTAARSHAALLAYEPFTNAPGTAIIGSSDGAGFANTWQANASGGVATNTSFSLLYTDTNGNTLVTDGGGSVHGAGFFQGLTNANTSMQTFRQFTFSRGTNGADGTTTWISFLAVRQGPASNTANPYPRGANLTHDFSAGDSTTTTFSQKLAVGNGSAAVTNCVALIPQGGGANIRQSTTPFSQTNFIVVRIDHLVGALDNAFLFVNPPLNAEPATNSALLATNSINSYDYSFDRIRVFAGGASAQNYAEWIVDEYRLGQTYADVAPYTGGSVVSTNNSLWASISVAANSATLTLTGTNNATYTVLASTNVALPVTNWLTLGTVTLNSSGTGTFTDTNALNSNIRRFYRAKSP
ncbi:MAG: hypothetical protein RLZZ350_51 [Verrucomicrobiota bacterium]|jgi:hypothetical protein